MALLQLLHIVRRLNKAEVAVRFSRMRALSSGIDRRGDWHGQLVNNDGISNGAVASRPIDRYGVAV